MKKTYNNVFVNSARSIMTLEDDQIVFQPLSKEKNSTAISSRNIDHVDWFVLSHYATLHIYTTAKLFYSVSELRTSDKEAITNYLTDEFSIGPEKIISYNVQYAGSNEGKVDFREKSFSLFSKDNRVIINIPYTKIEQIQATTNDLILEFDTDKDLEGESLLSIRFQVPTDAERTAKELHTELSQRTNLLAGTDNHIAELRDVKFLKPKKNYNIRFCNDLLFLCNKEGNHKIKYSMISMIHRFSIPSLTDKRREYILISLTRPIRQDQKLYPHLVIETSASDPVRAEGIDEKKTFIDAFEDLMYRVGEIKFQSTDKYFKNVGNEQGSDCMYKNNPGFLYMTPDAFVFLHSTVLYIPFKNVKSVRFEKIGKSNKKFTLTVTDKSTSYVFTNIDTYAYVQIDEKDDEDEESRIDREQMIKECSYNGLESFYKYIRKHDLRIEDRSDLKSKLSDMKAAITTHDRQSKVRAKEAMRDIKTEDKLLGVPEMDDDEEEDEEFNPDAKESDDDKDDGDEDDEEAEGGGDDDDDESGDKKGSDDDKDDTE